MKQRNITTIQGKASQTWRNTSPPTNNRVSDIKLNTKVEIPVFKVFLAVVIFVLYAIFILTR